MGVKRVYPVLIGLFLIGGAPAAQACLWDSDTLLQERLSSPKMAAAVFDEPRKPDVVRLQGRITTLRAAPRESDPSWWNDLAGAHLRLGELQTTVSLLEPAARRFPNDYGVHANLGTATAYHLLKRYPEAEREIARDLEINPDAHFGLERYHLALLQYLVRDPAYRARHVYVDEWTVSFLGSEVPRLGTPQSLLSPSAVNSFDPVPVYDGSRPVTLEQEMARFRKVLKASGSKPPSEREAYRQQLKLLEAMSDHPPGYRYRWDLADNPKFAEGVIYMATLNREEPACWVMLGIASIQNSDLRLGAAAFRRAIDLGSPQVPVLKWHIAAIRGQQRHSGSEGEIITGAILAFSGATVALALLLLFLRYRMLRRKRRQDRNRDAGRAPSIPASASVAVPERHPRTPSS